MGGCLFGVSKWTVGNPEGAERCGSVELGGDEGESVEPGCLFCGGVACSVG